ncbi:MAG: hypothetical protein WBB82_10145 [Limnothrix sp.]
MSTTIPTPNDPKFEAWLEQQILSLSVDALNEKVLTCTACGQVKGDYIIEYQGKSMRFDAGKTYGFLQYILAQSE